MGAENCLTVSTGEICDLDVGQFFIPKHITEKKEEDEKVTVYFGEIKLV
jgi:hypothetical protein